MKKTIKKIGVISTSLLAFTISAHAQWTETGSAVYLNSTTKNVGIGTTTPAFALDLIRSGNANLSLKSTTGTSNLLLDRANTNATSSVSYRTNGVGTWQTGTIGTNNFAIRNLGLGSPAFTVDALTNNVGIGTTGPVSKLDIIGSIKITDGSQAAGKVLTSDANGLASWQSVSGGSFPNGSAAGNTIYWNGAAWVTTSNNIFNNGGNVGIGTSLPQSKLSVASSGSNPVSIDGGTSMYVSIKENGIYRGYFGSYAGAAEDVDFGTGGGNTSGKLHFTIQGSPKMTIDAGGAVCINTTVPATGYKLSVNGKIMCVELRVLLNASWPDYVFSKNYDLMSLNDLQNYVDENKHLPGVKSAAAVEADGGVSVGEMQQTLLRKIEESNLYILQLNKRIADLEAQAKK
jgi:hypothetical protein